MPTRRKGIITDFQRALWNTAVGPSAFAPADKIRLENLDLTELHAGAYQDNIGSMKMLVKRGHIPYSRGILK
jgi:hypothetical protein